MPTKDDFELVVGVEVHAQLATESKLFCGCSTRFGAPPNSQTCPVCLGLPGVLPVVNRKAFEHVLRIALAMGCRVDETTEFDRKNYYYPDLPKNYQISQNYANLGVDGALELTGKAAGKRIRIHNVHLEEDAGKNVHPEGGTRDASFVDLNRAGTPLAEIVTYPDMRSLDEVEDYMETLRRLLLALGASDCKMQEGSLRFEASTSVRLKGEEKLGKRCEVKNLNSMRHVLHAVAYEMERQTAALCRGETLEQETRLWDDEKGATARMRSKEQAHDYRYFPEPDLPPFRIAREWMEELRATLPELPAARRKRFIEALGLTPYAASVLTETPEKAEFYEAVVRAGADPVEASNWVVNNLFGALNERGLEPGASPVKAADLAGLVALVKGGRVTLDAARKEVFPRMFATGKPAEAIVAELGLGAVGEDDLARLAREGIAANARAAEDYRKGKAKAAQAIVGHVMRATRGAADPKRVLEIVTRELDAGKPS